MVELLYTIDYSGCFLIGGGRFWGIDCGSSIFDCLGGPYILFLIYLSIYI